MKSMIKFCAATVMLGLLLGGCGGKNTETDQKIASLEQELEEERLKNEKLEKQSEQAAEEEKLSSFADRNVGDTITFGHFEQDNNTSNGEEEIEWLVLAKEDDKLLVISQYALVSQPYHTEDEGVTWEGCTLRKWLNDSFYDTAFSKKEQDKILTVTNSNPDSYEFYNSDYAVGLLGINFYTKYGYGAEGGINTNDKVFCLSYEEVLSYFASDEARKCKATDYAKKSGAGTVDDTALCAWWLRSSGDNQKSAMQVNDLGVVGAWSANYVGNAVRPALWISTK